MNTINEVTSFRKASLRRMCIMYIGGKQKNELNKPGFLTKCFGEHTLNIQFSEIPKFCLCLTLADHKCVFIYTE